MKKPNPPCGRKCESRTATCKVDGTCDKWAEYTKEKAAFQNYVRDNRRAFGEYMQYQKEKKNRL